ncbi:MAG TPA: hypothetical protein HA340_00055 [Candidatus Thalassarchaeaceae archaeon]|jgi:hypothetical protein|nr:hypothetical protein [Candidatus Thalassarchaeaceae archaeon]
MSDIDSLSLRDDIIAEMIGHDGSLPLHKSRYADHIQELVEMEEAEHHALSHPFDRSIALVLQMFQDASLDPWNIDLKRFIELFNQRLADAEDIDLPTCGRLLRMAWQILHGQAANLLERAENADQEIDDEWNYVPSWQTEFCDDDFTFTNTVLAGEAADTLPALFDGRIKRDGGRPVTLAELLSCLSEAHEDAEERILREASRAKHALDVQSAIANVKGRVHQENLEEEIRQTWNAIRELSPSGGPVTVVAVAKQLESQGIDAGWNPEDAEAEGGIVGFVSALFLTHRGYTDIWQVEYPNGDIFLQDKWPKMASFDAITAEITPEVSA